MSEQPPRLPEYITTRPESIWLKRIQRKDTNAATITEMEPNSPDLRQMAESLQTQRGGVVAVIRCWSRTPETMQTVLSQMERLKLQLPELAGLILSVNEEGEAKNPTTLNALTTIRNSDNPPTIPISALAIGRYHWTKGLNGPAALLSEIAQSYDIPTQDIGVAYFSTETIMDDEALRNWVAQYRETGHVLTAKNQDLIGDTEEVQSSIGETMQGISESRISETIPLIGRNTNSVFPLKELIDLGGFDNRANDTKGMEDHEFWLRLLLKIGEEFRKHMSGEPADTYYLELGERIMKLGTTDTTSVAYTAGGRLTEAEERTKLEGEKEADYAVLKRILEQMQNDLVHHDWKTDEGHQDFIFAT